MNQKHDPNQPIEVLIDKIETAIKFVDSGKVAFTPKQSVNISFDLI